MRICVAALAAVAAFLATVAVCAATRDGNSSVGPVTILPIVAAGAAFYAVAGKRFMSWFAETLPDTHEPASRTDGRSRP